MDAKELKNKMLATHQMDQQWSEAKGLIKRMEDVYALSLSIAESINNSNLSGSDKTLSIYFLGTFFKKITFEINCEIDNEEKLKEGG